MASAIEVTADRVEERIRLAAVGWDGQQSGRFIDDQQVLILEHETKRRVFALFGLLVIAHFRIVADGDRIARIHAKSRLGADLVIQAYAAVIKQAADIGSGATGEFLHDAVDPHRAVTLHFALRFHQGHDR
jgi:hypothetical protein